MKRRLLFLAMAMLPFLVEAQVIIYSACNYTGASASLGPGNYYNAFQFRLADNSISAIRVPAGFRVELYDNVNLFGTPVVLTGSVSCFGAGINNRVSSIRITYSYSNPWEGTNPDGGISIFTGCQYTGRYDFLPPGDYPRLRSVIGNDAVSSFRVPPGMVLELFRDENFQGISTGRITADNPCLGNYWNNQASSARVYYQDNGGWIPPSPPSGGYDGQVRMFSGCNYWGRSTSFREGVFNDLRAQLNNAPLGSVQISRGLELELYSGPGLTGSVLGRYTANQSCLSPEIQYRARSARIYAVGQGGGNWSGQGVQIYGDCGFRGRSKTLVAGRYSNLNSASIGINPASMRVSRGYTIELFSEPNFQGTSAGRITENEDCLGEFWRNRARSAIVTYNSSGGDGGYEEVVIYSDCNFRGRSQVIQPGYYNNMSLFNNSVVNPSSLRIPTGYKIELFLQDNFTGSKIQLTQSNSCISASWRGRVRSMIVTFNGSGGGNPWNPGLNTPVLYSQCYYNGANVTLQEGAYRDTRSIMPGGNNISSLKVPQGFEVDLYQNPGFSGRKITIQVDDGCINGTMRGRVGSVVVRRYNSLPQPR